MVRLAPVLLLAPLVASAQGSKPTVMPFPLEFKRVPPAMSRADREGLSSDAERLLRTVGVQLPDFTRSEAALGALKRQDCEREDACLQQLAQKAETLYALYANVDFTLEGSVVVTGRVVRDDGKVVAPLQVVRLPRGREKHRDVAKRGLTELYVKLQLKELPPVREVAPPPLTPPEPPPPAPPVVVIEPSVTLAPAPAPAPAASPVARGLVFGGAATVVLGAALAAVGGAVGGGARTVQVGDEFLAADAGEAAKLGAGRALVTTGFVALGVGAVAAAVGAAQWALAPATAPRVTLVPGRDGAALVVGGRF